MIGFFRRWRDRRDCFHHDRTTGTTWVNGYLVDLGRHKVFTCSKCAKVWS